MNRNSEQKSTERLAFEHWLRTGRRLKAAEWLAKERKCNPYHDPHDGRFTFAPGGSGAGGSSASMASRPANGGKPYPARFDFPAVIPKTPAIPKPPAPPAIRFDHRPNLGRIDIQEVLAKFPMKRVILNLFQDPLCRLEPRCVGRNGC